MPKELLVDRLNLISRGNAAQRSAAVAGNLESATNGNGNSGYSVNTKVSLYALKR